ncbi:MAG: aspartate--tRNA ligase, partial [Candidatus Methanomethylophilaceae archaeon]|nr:aspartate--tRNA ligase [Candidatus Methanomethylophilaceae archaeon]
IANGGIITGINIKKDLAGDKIGRNEVDRYINYVKKIGMGGLTWMRAKDGTLDSNIVKYFTPEIIENLKKEMEVEDGDLLFLLAGPRKATLEGAGTLRRKLAEDLDLIPKGVHDFFWLVDCPMFDVDPVTGKKDAFHHPFVLPDEKYEEGFCFDLCLDGNELGSGSQRIHDVEVQKEVFRQLGMSEEKMEEDFGFFLRALSYGAPPHGGIALGIDRFVTILLGKDTIRDVIAFPKNKVGTSLLDDSPAKVDDDKLDELQIMSMAIDDIEFEEVEEPEE